MYRLITPAIIAVIAIIFVMSCYFSVDAYETTLVTQGGAIVRTADAGYHLKWPWESTHAIRTDIQDVAPEKAVNTYTIDNQEVDVLFNVFYRIRPDKVAFVYQNVADFRLRLYTMATDRLKAEVGKINVTDVAEKRGQLRDAVKGILARDAAGLGVDVTDFQLTDLQYTKSFRDAVSTAAVSKAGIEGREYERQQALKVAETAKIRAIGEADGLRETARGRADSALLEATTAAKSIQLKGDAEAGAISAQANALKANPDLVNLRKAERWDGALPKQMLGGSPVTFMDVGK